MPRSRTIQNNFTTGVVAPTIHERYDYKGYENGLATLENFLPLPQGGVKRRIGTRYVATAKNATARRLLPFIFSGTQGAVIEAGDLYFRYYVNNGRLTSGGSPVETTTSFTEALLFDLYTAQSGDTMFIDCQSLAPHELLRLAATSWVLRTSRHTPAPSYEAGLTSATITLTLSATSGTAITVTASSALFFESSVGRTIAQTVAIGVGRLTITGYTNSTTVTAAVIDTFSTTALSTNWIMEASPQSGLRLADSTGAALSNPPTVGTQVIVISVGHAPANSNLISNGTFDTDLTDWTDSSGPEVAAGVSDAGGSDTELFDAAATFITDGVRAGHRALDLTNSLEDRVTSVDGEVTLGTSTNGADWTGAVTYSIKMTGIASVSGGKARLDGGLQGIAWIEQDITTVSGEYYRLVFDVANAPLSCMVGSATGLSDLYAEATFAIGNTREVIFRATGTTSYVQFRNNQNTVAQLDNVGCRKYEKQAWYSSETGKFVRVNDGIVEITEYASAFRLKGIVRKEPSTVTDALPGAWSLETTRWDGTSGFPRCVTFQGDRLIHAATIDQPQRFWGSVPGDYRNFATGSNDADAVELQPAATEVNQILWIFGERALIAGTIREEFTIRGELGHTLTPSGIDASSPSKIGSKAVKPLRTPDSLIFVARGGRRLYENVGIEDFSGDDRQVNDLSILTEHLTAAGIRSLAFQQEPDPVVWVVTEDDKLLSLTYHHAHKVFAWASHPTDGDVLDVCVIPHSDGNRDQVWLLVDRGGSAPYIEYMDDANGHYGQLMVDSGLTATYGSPTTTITGLSHLNGQTVAVLGDGSVQASKTVSGGVITLDTAATTVEVGLAFIPTLTTLRPTIDQKPLTGLQLSSIHVVLSLLETLGCTVNGDLVDFSEVVHDFDEVPDTYTGLKEISTVGWDQDAQITVSQTQPYPITIRAIARTLEIEQP